MLNFYNKLSPTTKLLIHGVLALVWSGVVTAGEAGYQSFTQSGQLNPPALLVTAWSAFLLYLIPAMYAYVPAHAQQIIQASKEYQGQLYDSLQRAQQIRSAQNIPAVSPVLLQAPAANPLTSDHLQSIAAQLAVNLINIASQQNAQAKAPQEQKAPVAPATPEPDPYVDPLRNSAVLPAYSIPDQTTQSVPVPFTV